ncbi:protein of unknown function [Taphrina deformans PYCC 5710]|uniref:Apple domain-containing protein n=1 Tax=Taphrina deformans (strain PYCC 5710 / ATCC 11124 / CBS 356.35 / IMI 108563 / JCM 9778 / NBRC 8474) TaxID=1097556 RepID=R4X9N9_TAPDE|nr:protein of unknown function [Taphrina deformans PYCC 5710]|eukprot:CCG82445.1 protein of unknown function [Taphrina deformans PYCC 5710]
MGLLSLCLLTLAAITQATPVEKRQSDGSATLAQRVSFLCPPGIDATLPLDAGTEAGLRFCSNIDRWSPATLYSSNPLSVGSGNYRVAASRCAALCTGRCQTFSVAPSTPGNATFGCNLYNATVPFRGNTNGGLFYARQSVAGALPSTTTVSLIETRTTCPVATQAAPNTPAVITGPTNVAAIVYPVVYHPAGQVPVTVTNANQVVTQTATVLSTVTTTIQGQVTTTVQSVPQESIAPFVVFIGQVGEIKIQQIILNVVTVIVVQVNGNINVPVTTVTTSAAPTATPNTFQCPAGIVGQYQDTTNSAFTFDLRFCSNVQRWSPADLFSSTQIQGASYASAAQTCSERCNTLECQTFSVAPTTVGGSTFGCNLYNATNVFNGPTNGGLFYQRRPATTSIDQEAQCVGAPGAVAVSSDSYSREFCSRTERWSPATLFDGTVQTGQRRGSVAPIVEAVNKCATRCSSFGAQCRTFSTTFTDQNAPIGDSAVPVEFNCNIYNNTLRVAGNTQGGAFYLKALASMPVPPINGTLARRYTH